MTLERDKYMEDQEAHLDVISQRNNYHTVQRMHNCWRNDQKRIEELEADLKSSEAIASMRLKFLRQLSRMVEEGESLDTIERFLEGIVPNVTR